MLCVPNIHDKRFLPQVDILSVRLVRKMEREITTNGMKAGLKIGPPNRHECSPEGQNDGEGCSMNVFSSLKVSRIAYGACKGHGTECVEWGGVPSGKNRRKSNYGGVWNFFIYILKNLPGPRDPVSAGGVVVCILGDIILSYVYWLRGNFEIFFRKYFTELPQGLSKFQNM